MFVPRARLNRSKRYCLPLARASFKLPTARRLSIQLEKECAVVSVGVFFRWENSQLPALRFRLIAQPIHQISIYITNQNGTFRDLIFQMSFISCNKQYIDGRWTIANETLWISQFSLRGHFATVRRRGKCHEKPGPAMKSQGRP